MSAIKKRNSKQLIWLFLAFALPIVLAKLLLSSGFRGEVTTHGGLLLTEAVSYQSLTIANPIAGRWQLLYIANSGCDDRCYQRLAYLQQTWQALGRLQDRVVVVLATNNKAANNNLTDSKPSDNKNNNAIADLINQQRVKLVNTGAGEAFPHDQRAIIVDPQGNLVMSFEFPDDQQQSLIVAHDLLLDIKQLLKLSRIG